MVNTQSDLSFVHLHTHRTNTSLQPHKHNRYVESGYLCNGLKFCCSQDRCHPSVRSNVRNIDRMKSENKFREIYVFGDSLLR